MLANQASDSTSQRRFARSQHIAVALAAAALIACLLALLGWIINQPRLTDWRGDGITMFANTALCGILIAAAVLSIIFRKLRLAAALGAAAGLIAAAVLLEHAANIDLRIDNLLVSADFYDKAAVVPGRMGPPASLSFTLLSIATLFNTLWPRFRRLSPYLALSVLCIATLSISGYFFGADPLFAVPHVTGIAFPTSTVLLTLGIACIAMSPDLPPASTIIDRSASGLLIRRALPVILVAPFALAWLRFKGEASGLYDSGMGTAMLVLVLVAMLCGLLWWSAASVRKYERALGEREEAFRTMFEVTSVGMAKADLQGRIIRVNSTFAAMLGRAPADIIGRPFSDFTHPDDVEPNDHNFHSMVQGHTPGYRLEKRFLRKDGQPVWAEVTANLVRRPDGTPLRAFAVIKDISESKAYERALAQRAHHQSLLYKFTDRLNRADSLDEVYHAAIDSILAALNCSRASILLFDDHAVMRFVAWRGLSEAYRRAVEGHSPWTPDTKDPSPITIEDITKADLPEPLRQTIISEGIGALAFIPLVVGGRLIGKFMAYHDTPQPFTLDQLGLALAVARQMAFGVERKRAETALRESEERLRLSTQTGKVGVWEWDIPTDRVLWTESLYGIHGISRQDFAGNVQAFAALIHPDDKDQVFAALERTLKENTPYELEFRIRRPDGGTTWVYTTASLIRADGKPTRMVGATLDITERKLIQLALAESESLFRTLGEAVPDFLWMADADGKAIYQNPAWSAYTGLSPDQLAQRGSEAVVHPDDLSRLRGYWSSAKDAASPFDFEGRLLRADGQYRWFTGRVVPLKNESGQVAKWVGTMTDIHDRKLLESDRDRHAAELAIALAQRTEQVTRAQQRLAATDRLAAVGTLAAGLGHDMSNLLLPLTVRLEGLKLRHDLPEDVRADIDAADALIGHLRALARNLRLFVRDPSRATGEATTDLADWSQHVQRFLGVIAGVHDGPGIRLDCDIPANIPHAAIAAHQLTQVVTNLIHNARDAIASRRAADPQAPAGRIRIAAAATPDNSEVRLWVSDNGCGMTEEVRRRCMEPFFTTRDRTKGDARTGTGIGLSTVYAAISQCGGRVELESELGQGATFTLHLPALTPTSRQAPLRPAAPHEPSPQPTALVRRES